MLLVSAILHFLVWRIPIAGASEVMNMIRKKLINDKEVDDGIDAIFYYSLFVLLKLGRSLGNRLFGGNGRKCDTQDLILPKCLLT